jgi:hypothetical protein
VEVSVRSLVILLLFAPSLLFAQSRFDGTWQMKMETLRFSATPEEYLLDKGVYHCLTCSPRVDAKADGSDQSVTGHYFDRISVRVLDTNSVEFIQKKNGKTTFVVVETVSADDKSMTEYFTNTMGAETVKGKAGFLRVRKGPTGAHALSGAWQMETVRNATRAGTLTTYRSTEGGLNISDGGQTYEVKFDGKDYPTSWDPTHATSSLRVVNESTIEETDKQDGRTVVVTTMTVSADGRSMKIESDDKLRNSTMTYTAEKLP